MSVGQSKALRAHQHKANRQVARTKKIVDDLKARQDRGKAQQAERKAMIRRLIGSAG